MPIEIADFFPPVQVRYISPSVFLVLFPGERNDPYIHPGRKN